MQIILALNNRKVEIMHKLIANNKKSRNIATYRIFVSRNFAIFTNVVSTPPNLAMAVADLLTTVLRHSHDMRSHVVVVRFISGDRSNASVFICLKSLLTLYYLNSVPDYP